MPCDHLTTMDPPLFVNHYSGLFRAMRFSGLSTPWVQKPLSHLQRLPNFLWDNVLMVMVVYMIWLLLYSMLTTYIPFQDLFGIGISITNLILGLLITIHFAIFDESIKKITVGMDAISETIMKNDLHNAEEYHRMYIKNSKLMNVFTTISVSVGTFQPMVFFSCGPIIDLFTGNFRTRFPVKIKNPFDDKQPIVYELLVLTIVCSVSCTVAKKIVSDCLFLTLFRIERAFLKYLSVSMNSLLNDSRNFKSAFTKRKVIQWVSLHQRILKNTQDLVLVYSPVIIYNYINLICNIVCAAFIVTMKDKDSIVQIFTVSIYSIVVLTYLFLIADVAHQISEEIQHLSLQLYSSPWYQMKKDLTYLIKLVTKVSNKPIQVTAYKTSVFLLNRETFSGFLATTLSAFLTFCQIKVKLDKRTLDHHGESITQ